MNTLQKVYRHLAILKCLYNGGLDAFVFQCEGNKVTLQHIAPKRIALLFKHARVKDEVTTPRSVRGETYLEMVTNIMEGRDKINYIWSSDIETFFNECKALNHISSGVFVSEDTTERRNNMLLLQEGYRGEGYPHSNRARSFKEAGKVCAIARAAGVSHSPLITNVSRGDTVFLTVQAMGLPVKINRMNNVVAEVPDMQTAGSVLQTIYQQFGVKGSFMVTWEGRGKLYWAPETPVDRSVALSYAKQNGLPPPRVRGYLESFGDYKTPFREK